MSFTIKEGTRPTKRLCDTCTYSHIIKGPQQGQEEVYCSNRSSRIPLPFPVVECSYYSLKGSMDEYDVKQIGWILEVKAGKVLGFKPPSKDDK